MSRIVLIEPGMTPTGWGVEQDDIALYVTTPCCGARATESGFCTKCQKDYRWFIKKCEKNLAYTADVTRPDIVERVGVQWMSAILGADVTVEIT